MFSVAFYLPVRSGLLATGRRAASPILFIANAILDRLGRLNKETEKTILWNDPDLRIEWPIRNPVVSEKDRNGRLLKDLRPDELFRPELVEGSGG